MAARQRRRIVKTSRLNLCSGGQGRSMQLRVLLSALQGYGAGSPEVAQPCQDVLTDCQFDKGTDNWQAMEALHY